jgi:hypothetical protein
MRVPEKSRRHLRSALGIRYPVIVTYNAVRGVLPGEAGLKLM